VKAQEIADYLKLKLAGNPDRDVSSVAHVELAKSYQLAYWSGDITVTVPLVYTEAGTLICKKPYGELATSRDMTTITSEQPRYDFGKVVERFFMWQTEKKPQISKSAVIHPTATLNVEGMNYSRGRNGDLQKVPHVGGLIVADNVEVGALTTIQRGVLKDTVIGEGTKIGPKCNIGHGAHIGEHCLVTGMNFIGGSVVLGNRVYVAPHSTIKNGVKVGDDVFIGIGSLILHDVPSGATVVGRPAVLLEQFRTERERLKNLLHKR